MRKRNTRLRGMALAAMIAVLPMLIVISSVSAVLIGRVLRVQREATYRVVNTENAARLVERMRRDAVDAESVAIIDDGSGIIFRGSALEGDIGYRIGDGFVTRTDSEAGQLTEQKWPFAHAQIDMEIEDSSVEGRRVEAPLVWVRISYQVELRKNVVDVGELATAIRVGQLEQGR